MRKPYTKMTSQQLAEATREFDAPSPAARFRPMTDTERRAWSTARRGAAKKRQPLARVAIAIDRDLLVDADQYARVHGLSRAELFARGLRSVLVASGAGSTS